MEIKRELNVFLETSDNKTMVDGRKYIFATKDKCYCGIYKGIDRKGSIRFLSVVGKVPLSYSIMPKSILTIYECDVVIQ